VFDVARPELACGSGRLDAISSTCVVRSFELGRTPLYNGVAVSSELEDAETNSECPTKTD